MVLQKRLIIDFHALQLIVALKFQSTLSLLKLDNFDFESKLHIITSGNFASSFLVQFRSS